MKQLDLGCGNTARIREGYEGYGVDVVNYDDIPSGLHEYKTADLTLEKIPFKDDTFDLVTAYDFLEHVPMVIYMPERRSCMIELFNEIWRVLKPGGEFYSQTPAFIPGENNTMVWQDPTHVSVWTPDTFNYFSGDYFGHHDTYSHKSDFVKAAMDISNGHINVTLRAQKPAREAFYL